MRQYRTELPPAIGQELLCRAGFLFLYAFALAFSLLSRGNKKQQDPAMLPGERDPLDGRSGRR